MNLSEFFAMGGYAAYVWPSYCIVVLVLIGNVIAARASHRRAAEEALRRLSRQEKSS